MLARDHKVTLHAIGRRVVVMGKLDIAKGAREPQDLVVFARMTLSALRRSSGDGQLRVTIPDFCMAFNTLLM